MGRVRIEMSYEQEDWRVIAIDLALAKMSTPEGQEFLTQLIGKISMNRDQDSDDAIALRAKAREAYRKLKGADILIDEEATVYADEDGGKWVQGWLRIPGASVEPKDGILSLDTNY
jgi:hypothetical protein